MLRWKAKREDSTHTLEGPPAPSDSTTTSASAASTKGPGPFRNGNNHRKNVSSEVRMTTPTQQYQPLSALPLPALTSSSSGKNGQVGGDHYGSDIAGASTHDAIPQSGTFKRPHIPARHTSASGSIDLLSKPLLAPSAPSYNNSNTQPLQQQQQENTLNAGNNAANLSAIGRSQSTLNFFFSKAKASFSSSYQQQQHQQQGLQSASLNASASLSSVHSVGSGQQDDNTSRASDSYAPTMASSATPISTPGAGRSPAVEFATPRYPSNQMARPSIESASTSSPTKRSFFGGGRERKVSVNSIGKGSAAMLTTPSLSERGGWGGISNSNSSSKLSFPHSPLAKGHRTEGSGFSYGQFSKSQSDLHMRAYNDFPSPVKKNVHLPSLHHAKSRATGKGGGSDANFLQSPVNNLGFSRSVDDLSRSSSPDLRLQPSQEKMGLWGGLGLMEEQSSRPGDTGDTAASRRKEDLGDSMQSAFASTSSHKTNMPSRSPAWSPKSMYGSAMPPPPVPFAASSKRPAASHQDGSLPRGQQSPIKSSHAGLAPTTKNLAAGVTYEGFLNRNANISLSFPQLVDAGTVKGKEKDLGRGWKPYKAVMREGKLYFYKASSAHTDEIKSLFPAGIVTGALGSPVKYVKDLGITMDDIKRSKVSTQDLIAATSRGAADPMPPLSRPPARAAHAAPAFVGNSTKDGMVDAQGVKTQDRERNGKHPELTLVEGASDTVKWSGRIEGGSLQALVHEYIFATQSELKPEASGSAEEEEAEEYLYYLLIATCRSGKSLQMLMTEVVRWAKEAMGNYLSSGEADSKDEDKQQRIKRLQVRVSLLLHSDIINAESDRQEMLDTMETLINAVWDTDKTQAEAHLASLLATDISTTLRDWPEREEGGTDGWTAALSPSSLLSLDPAEAARQIHIFTANRFNALRLPSHSLLRLLHPQNAASLHLLSHDWSRPNFLTRLVLDHILQSNGALEGGTLHSAKLRASLLRHWIAIASFLLKLNDTAAWFSICVALCSRPIARLATSWRFVASNDRALVGTVWAPILVETGWTEMTGFDYTPVETILGSASSIKSSMNPLHHARMGKAASLNATTPYLGNSLIHVELRTSLLLDGLLPGAGISMQKGASVAMQVLSTTKQWRAKWSPVSVAEGGAENLELQQALQSLCQISEGATATFDPIPFLAQSLQLEPITLGKVDVSRKVHMTKTIATCAQSPFLFPEPLPNLSIINREEQERIIASTRSGESSEVRKSPTRWPQTLPMEGEPMSRRPSLLVSPLTRARGKVAKEIPFINIFEWNGLPLQDMQTIKIGPDLTLISKGEQSNSQPTTPMLSKRFSQDMNAASRPVSQISKRSSLPASNRSSLIEVPIVQLQVLVKSASLDRLVDVTVMGLHHVDINTADDGVERKRSHLHLDMSAHRKTLLSTYRSFCTPVTLLDLLRKRFAAAIIAGREMSLPLQHRSAFPSWSQFEAAASENTAIDWDIVGRIRSGVISFLTLWINLCPQDFAENDQLYKGLLLWVLDTSAMPGVEGDPDWEKHATSLLDIRKKVQLAVMTCCIKQGERRAVKRTSKRNSSQADLDSFLNAGEAGLQTATLDFDDASPSELVNYLESVAKVFYDKIEEKDLLMACELFHSRTTDPMAWYIAKNSTSTLASQHPDEMPQVNNMYKLIELVRWPRDGPTVSLRLAASIRDACAAQNLLRGWIAIHIIESKIGLVKRERRIEKLLDAVWICRARMLTSRTDEATGSWQSSNVFRDPTIASFVECLIVGSLTSSESRLFTRAWQGVAARRKGNCDNLTTLSPSTATAEAYRDTTSKISTPDIGWLLKMLAEVTLRHADYIPEDGSVVDFHKYRTLWELVEASTSFYPKTKADAIDPDLVELAGARLNAMQASLRNVKWERRAFKEDAAMEAGSASPLTFNPTNLMRGNRPLLDIVSFQQEKHRRDRYALEILEFDAHQKRTQKALAAAQMAKSSSAVPSSTDVQPPFARANAAGSMADLSSSSQSRSATWSQVHQTQVQQTPMPASGEKRTRRMTALFRGAVRPIGLMGSTSAEKTGASGVEPVQHSIAELLAMTPAQKPAFVVNCGSGQVNAWNNHQKSFVFHLSSPADGTYYLLQAPSHAEMAKWCGTIETASKEYALPPAALAIAGGGAGDGAKTKGGKKSAAAAAAPAAATPAVGLYGTDIQTLVDLEKRPVPLGLLRMLEEVESRGLREQGIYRVSGAKNAIDALKLALTKQPALSVDLRHGELSDIHTIAGAIKQWFRDLPEPVVPFAFYHRLLQAEGIEKEEDRLYAIRDLVWEFPKAHFELLRRVSQHLAMVCDEGKFNLMAPHNIGLVFGTSLLNPPPGPTSVAESFGNIGKAAHVVKILLTMHEWLFEPEPEPEVEAEAEAELEPELELEPTAGDSETATLGRGNEVDAVVLPETEQMKRGEQELEPRIPPSSSSQATLMPSKTSTTTPRIEVPSIKVEEDKSGGSEMERGESSGPRRNRAVTESIYLDATDAIAVLQDPFAEVEEDDEEEES